MPDKITPLRTTMIKMAPLLRTFWEGFKQGLKEESLQALDLLVRERQGRLEAERRASKAEAKLLDVETYCRARAAGTPVLFCMLNKGHEGHHAAIARKEDGERACFEWGGDHVRT